VVDGKYRLTRRIGEGGMGTVFEGENIRIKRKVAIKVLHDHVATSPEFAQRFVREARASARIGSEHVCDVLDLGDLESGEKYIVMELLDGESLEQRLDKGRLEPNVIVPLAFEILEGLGAMHQVGVIHRDLKPANVFLCNKKGGGVTVKILDFGVAKVEASDEDPSGIHDMTSTGTMMGTPLYMSPEQARGARDVDGRTDLYAASVIMYQSLTGETPHQGGSLHELLFKIVLDDPKPIQSLAPDVDDELAELVMKGLSRDVDHRYSSAREYQEALKAWGAKHDLSFQVTLPSEPPPLRKQTGGFPAAIIETAGQALRTGNTPISQSNPRISIPDDGPVDVHALTHPSAVPLPPSDSRVPAVSATVKAASAAPDEPVAVKGGDTLLAGAAPKDKAASVSPDKPASVTRAKAVSTAPAEPQGGTSKTTIIIAVLVALVAAIVGSKLGSSGSATPTQPSAVPSQTAAPPPSVPHSSAPSAVPSTEPVPAVTASSSAGLPATAPVVQPNAAPQVKPTVSTKPVPMPAVSGHIINVDAGF